jgi:hypothetical protein
MSRNEKSVARQTGWQGIARAKGHDDQVQETQRKQEARVARRHPANEAAGEWSFANRAEQLTLKG